MDRLPEMFLTLWKSARILQGTSGSLDVSVRVGVEAWLPLGHASDRGLGGTDFTTACAGVEGDIQECGTPAGVPARTTRSVGTFDGDDK